jgi:hypothetical protein
MESPQLHSRYNPRAEAARYIDALALPPDIRYFILIEPGMGYLAAVLRQRFPGAHIVILHADDCFKYSSLPEAAEFPAWYPGSCAGSPGSFAGSSGSCAGSPGSGTTVQDFLEAEFPDNMGLICKSGEVPARIIEWRPGLMVYGERYAQLVAEAADFIKRAAAGGRTTSAFGRRWVKNAFKNLRLLRRALSFTQMECPVIITGSGPGLEETLDTIRALHEGSFIIAASSSLLALEHARLVPDLVISADGGSWALTHLYSCFRGSGEDQPAGGQGRRCGLGLAAALTAALPSQCRGLPFLVLNDGSLWQSIILHSLAVPSLVIPQRGTVTASGVDLALALSSGGVYLAGVDLSLRGVQTHARPYAFDRLFFDGATRLRPRYSQGFERALAMKQGGSHGIYAAWFKKQLASWPARVFSLGGGSEVFGASVPPPQINSGSSAPIAARRMKAYGASPFSETPVHFANPCEKAAQALTASLKDGRFAEPLANELAPLLFPGEQKVSVENLSQALDAITAPYRSARHG